MSPQRVSELRQQVQSAILFCKQKPHGVNPGSFAHSHWMVTQGVIVWLCNSIDELLGEIHKTKKED